MIGEGGEKPLIGEGGEKPLPLTFRHRLEVHFPAVASVTGHCAGSHLEDVNCPGFEVWDGHRIGEALDRRGIKLAQILQNTTTVIPV